jgi:cytochrome P450
LRVEGFHVLNRAGLGQRPNRPRVRSGRIDEVGHRARDGVCARLEDPCKLGDRRARPRLSNRSEDNTVGAKAEEGIGIRCGADAGRSPESDEISGVTSDPRLCVGIYPNQVEVVAAHERTERSLPNAPHGRLHHAILHFHSVLSLSTDDYCFSTSFWGPDVKGTAAEHFDALHKRARGHLANKQRASKSAVGPTGHSGRSRFRTLRPDSEITKNQSLAVRCTDNGAEDGRYDDYSAEFLAAGVIAFLDTAGLEPYRVPLRPRRRRLVTDTFDSEAASALFSPAVADDPHPTYRRIRKTCPVARTAMEDSAVVLISRYDDVCWALRHPEYFTSAGGSLNLGEQPLIPLEFDPPQHTKYRRLLSPQFVPREIQKLEPEVRRIVRGLIDGVAAQGWCDFHEQIATPLPSEIFLTLMGLPGDDLPLFLRWRDESIRPAVEPGDFEGAQRIRAQTAHEISEYFRGAIARCREVPSDSLLSRIVHATIDGQSLSEAELLGMSHLLLLGGLDTVTATLDCMVGFLATHPEHRRQLVDDPSITPAAVEELLRWLTPVMVIPRSIKEDVEMGGVQLQAGDGVMLVIGAANDDESEFPDPDVDFERRPNRHVAFGGSNHSCLGVHLARLELRVTLEELHRRIPDYWIPDGVEIHFSPGIRQAERLQLEFDPA